MEGYYETVKEDGGIVIVNGTFAFRYKHRKNGGTGSRKLFIISFLRETG